MNEVIIDEDDFKKRAISAHYKYYKKEFGVDPEQPGWNDSTVETYKDKYCDTLV